MSDYVLRLSEDLRAKLDRLCLMHNEPALFEAEHFADLRRQVDLDAEDLLSKIQKAKENSGNTPSESDVNATRLEFIRILDELEKRTGHQPKPQAASSEVYASLEQRVESFKDLSCSLDDLEETYVQLAQEVSDEIERVEKRILGEQTIIYWLSEDKDRLGSLVYFGDLFLTKRDFDLMKSKMSSNGSTFQSHSSLSSFLVPANESFELNKAIKVIMSLYPNALKRFGQASKFFYVGKTKEEYSGYSAEESSVDREFIGYLSTNEKASLETEGDEYLDTSANLFDVYSSKNCEINIKNLRLESLHVNLLPSPADRLNKLILNGVHFESFDTTLLAKFTNLNILKIRATFSRDVQFDLEFLRPLIKLKLLELTLPGSSWSFDSFKELCELRHLKLEASSFFYAEKRPRLSKASLEQILSALRLERLKLSGFDIEAIDRKMLTECKCLTNLNLTQNNIEHAEITIANLAFPFCYNFEGYDEKIKLLPESNRTTCIRFILNDHLVLNAASFAGMTRLTELTLTGNSIAELPCGVFQDLFSLKQLNLGNNLIKHIKCGVFNRLGNLKYLKMAGNPIESIEPYAFAQLKNLVELVLSGCRLKSIDSETFVGLQSLPWLNLENNMIERIEVVTEDGRRINVAKANLSDEERELINKHLFKDLSHLFKLNLDRNKLGNLDLGIFRNLVNMHKLILSSNLITKLGKVENAILSKLETLDLSKNLLSTIENDSLPRTITDLNLAQNKLQRLDQGSFANLTKLERLDLSKNELSIAITDPTFASCRENISIDLHGNKSIKVAAGAFRPIEHVSNRVDCSFREHFYGSSFYRLSRIRELNPEVMRSLQMSDDKQLNSNFCFHGCSIKRLTRNPKLKRRNVSSEPDLFNLSWFPDPLELSYIDFSRNLIERLDDSKLFADMKNIDHINLSNNQLTQIDRDVFKGLSYLVSLDLSRNKLSSVDMGLFRSITNLKHLDLSSNCIGFLNLARLFRVCSNLKSLEVAENQLDERSTAEPIDSRSSNRLEKLVLANNRLEKMDFVCDMTHLERLNLRGNRIESVMSNKGENMLGRLFNLTHLDLSGNRISSLTDEMFAHLRGQLVHFDISGNCSDSVQMDIDINDLI